MRPAWFGCLVALVLVPLPFEAADSASSTAPAVSRGRLLAAIYCQQCHALPEPERLDRKTWKEELLPKMAFMAGVMPPPPSGVFMDMEVLKAARYFPEKPMIPRELFDEISEYYVGAAPVMTQSAPKPAEIGIGLRHFSASSPKHRRKPALTTLLRIDPRERIIVMGDATSQGVDLLSPQGVLLRSMDLGNIPTAMVETPLGFYFGAVGHFFPRDEPRGQLLFLSKSTNGLARSVIGGLMPRVTDVQVADLNGDGLEDVVVCGYGNMLGRLSWFERKPGNQFQEHVLLEKPGALRSVIRDLNGDNHPDIGVLFAQALESFMVWTSNGRGAFQQHIVYQKDPSWGHSGFEMADFNGDGRDDLLVTNGDNADFSTSPMRAHHGVRVLLNKGGMKFEEAWFYPINGAYRAVARDFDQDGDMDIAAISFFPDFEKMPRESFVYLENIGGRERWDFSSSTFRETISGRWLTLEAGDMDGDGDNDLVLGSLIEMPTQVPEFLKKQWEDRGPSLVILRNTLKQP